MATREVSPRLNETLIKPPRIAARKTAPRTHEGATAIRAHRAQPSVIDQFAFMDVAIICRVFRKWRLALNGVFAIGGPMYRVWYVWFITRKRRKGKT